MTTLRALIIDDEPLAHKVILTYARDVPFLEIVGQAYLATEAFSLLREQPVDLLFLDIQMPKLQGLDFLRSLPNPPLVIITSAYAEYALESYELNVCDYLLKPFRFDRFLRAVNKAMELLMLKNRKQEFEDADQSVSENEDHIFIKVDKRFIQVNISAVFHLESYGNYVKVWLADTYHLTPRTLTSFEEQLPPEQFLRIHKSYIINRQQIDFVEGNQVRMKNGQEVSVGKSYRQTFRQFIEE